MLKSSTNYTPLRYYDVGTDQYGVTDGVHNGIVKLCWSEVRRGSVWEAYGNGITVQGPSRATASRRLMVKLAAEAAGEKAKRKKSTRKTKAA